MMGRTTSGFEFQPLDKSKLADMRVIDALTDVVDGNLTGLTKLLRLVMEPVERARLYSHCTAEDGKVSPEAVAKEFFEILNYREDPEAKK